MKFKLVLSLILAFGCLGSPAVAQQLPPNLKDAMLKSIERRRPKLEAWIKERTAQVKKICELDEKQEKALRAAGEATVKEVFASAAAGIKALPADPANPRDVTKALGPLIGSMRNPEELEKHKTWQAALKKTLSEKQLAKWEKNKPAATAVAAVVRPQVGVNVAPAAVIRPAMPANYAERLIERYKPLIDTAANRMKGQLQSELNELKEFYNLSDAQARKLDAATKGAVVKYFAAMRDEMSELEARLPDIKDDVNAGNQLATDVRAFYSKNSLNLRSTKTFESPFWQSTVRKTLSPEQSEHYERERKSREEFAQRSWAYAVVVGLDKIVRLRAEQRTQLVDGLQKWLANASPANRGFALRYPSSRTTFRYNSLFPLVRSEVIAKVLTEAQQKTAANSTRNRAVLGNIALPAQRLARPVAPPIRRPDR